MRAIAILERAAIGERNLHCSCLFEHSIKRVDSAHCFQCNCTSHTFALACSDALLTFARAQLSCVQQLLPQRNLARFCQRRMRVVVRVCA